MAGIAGVGIALCAHMLAGDGGRNSSRSVAVTPATASVSLASASPSLPLLHETGDHLPAGSPGYTVRREIPEVRLQFTVADEQGRAIRDLLPEDVRVFDNQTPVARFSHFEREDDLPLEIGLLLDTSDSVKRALPEEKAAAGRFLERILRAGDTAFVSAFGGEVKMWQEPTGDRQKLVAALEHLMEPGWGTRFYDALYTACAGQLAPGDKLARRALIVLSDGNDTQSLWRLRDVVAIAQRSDVQIFALTIREGTALDRGDLVLQRVTDATGGRVYAARTSKDLDGAFAQIEQDLRTQYSVSFPPQQLTPGFHSLRLEVRPPQKLQVHARQGYYASAQ